VAHTGGPTYQPAQRTAGVHREQVRTEAVDLVADPPARALADRHHGDDRRNADDHPEHRQRAAQPAGAQTLQ